MDFPKRKPNRLSYYDYSTPGAYFLTICTKDRLPLLGKVVGGGALDAPLVQLTGAGRTVERYILSGENMAAVTVDKYVIMPNHIHIILIVGPDFHLGPSRAPAPTHAIVPRFVSALKRFCHRDIGEKIFQRSYHDHVIRNEQDYLRIWQYIDTNPACWRNDCFYTPQ